MNRERWRNFRNVSCASGYEPIRAKTGARELAAKPQTN